ncbi:MAG: hypothetical protein IH613_01855 [Desulfuromonadales bacterium]|nr:hypothetical protein [Desulfuromonadales bacterium]
MREMKKIVLFLMLILVTACAPVVHDAVYRAPTRHTSVRVYQQVHPIEVTLYADNSYRGVFFKPIHFIILDGQYVEIPVRDRRGRHSKIYAHYHQNNLHFDADRYCQGIHGSSRFSYDNSWDKGHGYSNINAGKDYNLTGLRLQVRNASSTSQNINNKAAVKRPVVKISEEAKHKQVAVKHEKYSTGRSDATNVDHVTKKQNKTKGNQLIIDKNSDKKHSEKVVRATSKPEIIEKKSGTAKSVDKKQHANQTPNKKKIKTTVRQNSRDKTEPRKIAGDVNKKENTVVIIDGPEAVSTKRSNRSDKENAKDSRSNKKTDNTVNASQDKTDRKNLADKIVAIDDMRRKFKSE